MKMRRVAVIFVLMLVVSLTACSNAKALEAAQAAVDSYNAAVEEYNTKASAFNEVATQVNEANAEFQGNINAAQDVINKGEDPFDENTLTELKTVMADASNAKKGDVEILEAIELLSVSQDMKSKELKEIEEKATAEIENVKALTIPSTPEVPDYSEYEEVLQEKLKAYENSVQGMKQVTAPSDEFVIERLQRIETITEIGAVTEDHDPNGQLNKQGGYIGCIYFEDSQVYRSELYIEDGKDNVIDIGTKGGGAVEIFKTVEEATTRDTYLGSFDGMGALASGSHYLVGTCLVRTSNELNGTQQLELTDQIRQALIAVDSGEEESESVTEEVETPNDNEQDNENESSAKELNSLQVLFASINDSTTREEIDEYIESNELVKYAFTHDSAYYIGYEQEAIRHRASDREGEAVDVNFVTSGDMEKIGTVSSAQYAIHTGFSTHYPLEYKDGIFYYEGQACSSGDEAMQLFLSEQ